MLLLFVKFSQFWYAKVYEFYSVIFCYKNVTRSDISMPDAFSMHLCKSCQNLGQEVFDLAIWEQQWCFVLSFFLLLIAFLKALSDFWMKHIWKSILTVFSHDADRVASVENIVNLADMFLSSKNL